jgi:soluble lytic murein transglycosylase
MIQGSQNKQQTTKSKKQEVEQGRILPAIRQQLLTQDSLRRCGRAMPALLLLVGFSLTNPGLLTGNTLDEPQELFRRAYHSFQQRDYANARRLFSRTLETDSVLADYSLYYLGRLNRQQDDPVAARGAFLRLLTEHPRSTWAGRAALEIAKLALAANNWPEATRYAEQARTADLTPTAVRNAATLILAQAREKQGNTNVAYDLYQGLRRSTPRSDTGKAAKARVLSLRDRYPDRFPLASARAYLGELRVLAQEGDSNAVESIAQQFVSRFPSSGLRSAVLRIQARSYKQQGRIDEATAALEQVVNRYPESASAPAALYDWAALLWNKDRDSEARPLFERLTQRYPQHGQAPDAWYAIGRIFQTRGEDDHAARAYQQLASRFPAHELAREARWRQAWMAYQRKDFRQAENLFGALAGAAPDTVEGQSALYWQARSAGQRGEKEKETQGYQSLLRRYPDGYYAVWAEKRLNRSPARLNPGPERTANVPALPSPLERHYRRSQELQAIGLRHFAKRELDARKKRAGSDPAFTRFLLVEYNRVGGHAIALQLAMKLGGSGGSWLRYIYPHAYWDLITTQARKKQLDPYLVVALIRQESLFNPEAVSPARAYGLMQLLPSTAARLTGSSPSVAKLTDPTWNLEVGMRYLRQLLDRYNGDRIPAIAAYNAGEGAADKWRARHPDLAPDEFIENISYRETRTYVKLVLRNYRMYQRLYSREK